MRARRGWLARRGARGAGGLLLYEIGTEDVGLASAGYTARAQDASTVFTNPAGMTRLQGTQRTAALQALYGDVGFSIGRGTSPGLGSGDGGNPVGWFPGGGGFVSYSVSPDLKLGFAAAGNFGLAMNYDSDWSRRVLHPGRHAGRAAIRAVRRLSGQPAMVGGRKPQRNVREDADPRLPSTTWAGPTGMLVVDDYEWGFGGNARRTLRAELEDPRFGLVWNSQIKLDFSDLTPGVHRALARA